MRYRIIFMLSFLLVLTGCSTIMRYTYDDKESCEPLPYIYGGTVIDWHFLTGGGEGEVYEGGTFPSRFIGFVDMPFSFVADTVMLPVSIPMQVNQSKRLHCENGTPAENTPNDQGSSL